MVCIALSCLRVSSLLAAVYDMKYASIIPHYPRTTPSICSLAPQSPPTFAVFVKAADPELPQQQQSNNITCSIVVFQLH